MKNWHYVLLVIATGAMMFSLGHSIQPEPQAPRVILKYVPVCEAIPLKAAKPIKISELMQEGRK